MNSIANVDTDKLMEEVDRYLVAVDLFRALGCEPTWRVDTTVDADASVPAPSPHPAPSIRHS